MEIEKTKAGTYNITGITREELKAVACVLNVDRTEMISLCKREYSNDDDAKEAVEVAFLFARKIWRELI